MFKTIRNAAAKLAVKKPAPKFDALKPEQKKQIEQTIADDYQYTL